MDTVIKWLISAVLVLVVSYILPGVTVTGFFAALVVALVLGLINTFVRPLLIALTLPVTVVTLGLFLFVINALMIMLAAFVVPGFSVASFWWALIFSLILSVADGLVQPDK